MSDDTTSTDDEEVEIPVTPRDTIGKRLREYRHLREGGGSGAASPAPTSSRSASGARPQATTVVEELVDLTGVEEPGLVDLTGVEEPEE